MESAKTGFHNKFYVKCTYISLLKSHNKLEGSAKRSKCAQRGDVKVWRKDSFLFPVAKIKDKVKVNH